jgi:hypothetical protein
VVKAHREFVYPTEALHSFVGFVQKVAIAEGLFGQQGSS